MANWTWFHRLGSPKWFYERSSSWLKWLVPLTVLVLLTGLVWGLAIAPPDAKQGNSMRIFYIHVPSAMLSLAGFYLMAIAGAVGLIWRMKLAFVAMQCSAPIGAALTAIALITGAIWGKPTWGTYWVWDAKLTSMLILFFLYLGVMALQEAYSDMQAGAKASAVLALVGTVNIPIIYKAADWWNTLHQPATFKFTEKSSIDPSMAWPFWVMIVGFYGFFAVVLFLRMRNEILYRERRTQWVQALLGKPEGGS
ncbi:MAG: heme ABC transporter permease [Porticoccaceae bacterium]|nr:heme ABC transporter permease [Porticoccaceae bacterium]